jgi:hypothetical protein
MHPTQALPALWFLIFTPFISPSSALDLGLSNRTLNTTQCLDNIERIAHGRIPAASAPLNISSEGIKSLQLIAFNELFEIAFFSSLISNISSDEPGFIVRDERRRDGILRTLRRILAVSWTPGPKDGPSC